MLFILNIFTALTANLKLNSGKKITVKGRGPPVLFSTGLFGTMPQFFYNNLINDLKKKLCIIEIKGAAPIVPKDIYDITNALKVNQIAYVSHSSFNPHVLETDKIYKAVLIDPICVPELTINGFESKDIYVKYPVQLYYAEKLLNTEIPLPDWQKPNFYGDIQSEIVLDVGHPDILDNLWANIAKRLKLWGTAENNIVDFNDWKYSDSNTIPKIRKQYRKYISNNIVEFIGKKI